MPGAYDRGLGTHPEGRRISSLLDVLDQDVSESTPGDLGGTFHLAMEIVRDLLLLHHWFNGSFDQLSRFFPAQMGASALWYVVAMARSCKEFGAVPPTSGGLFFGRAPGPQRASRGSFPRVRLGPLGVFLDSVLNSR